MNKLSIVTTILASTFLLAGAQTASIKEATAKPVRAPMPNQRGSGYDMQNMGGAALSGKTGSVMMKGKQGDVSQSWKPVSKSGDAQGAQGTMMAIPPMQVTTGDPEIDAQIKVLTTEMEAKLKAIHEEYAAKIKAIAGDKLAKTGPQGDAKNTDMMKKMNTDMTKKMEEVKNKRAAGGEAPEMPVYMDQQSTTGTVGRGKMDEKMMGRPQPQAKVMQEGVGGIRYNNLFNTTSLGGN